MLSMLSEADADVCEHQDNYTEILIQHIDAVNEIGPLLVNLSRLKRALYLHLPKTDQAFILVAFAVVLLFETTGGDEE